MTTKEKKLAAIAREIEQCRVCKRGKIGKAVPGEGSANARVVFLGEAPGKKEAESGRPFIGRSGQLLRSLIRAVGLTEADVYITSPVKYLPSYGTPTQADIEHGKKHLHEQLAVIEPNIVVLLGSVAGKAVLDTPLPVKTYHGTAVKKDGVRYYVTLHPAAGLRFPPLKKLLEADFKKLKKLL